MCLHAMSRRQFLKGVTAATGLLASGALTSQILRPTRAAASPVTSVAIAKAANYEPTLIRQQVQAVLDGMGNFSQVVRPGDVVAIKVNLVAGAYYPAYPGVSQIESYMTHPEVVRALIECLRDAGVGKILLIEAAWDRESFAAFGYEEIANDLDATLLNLNAPAPYQEFAKMPVAGEPFCFDHFQLHPQLQDINVLVSAAKMKCHYNAGVSLSMKNLIGLTPMAHYQINPRDSHRTLLHLSRSDGDPNEVNTRLPRVILDVNRARPIQLALIDGVKASEGGEIPRGSFKPVQPGVLIAGSNPVATDAVATAVMGFDPAAPSFTAPFIRADNYLAMASELGLGTNRLEDIQVVGVPIEQVRYQFNPSTRQ